ncbi:XRE family transcriptional regulator [Salmonella enterica subsp. enterica]|uniref:XRE family transcriptional regulator n=1 Tax=Salmonella enterica subsp. enterica serovar Java TaxID=224729 RepID=A0A3Y9C7L6_SALEB|nr:XRE family transcriptional regulator [Salmonella enterica subsp. enterica serovar Java]
MTGYELRLWRKSLGWSRDKAADELGVCLRSYKDYENAEQVRRGIALATVSLSIQSLLSEFAKRRTSGEKMRTLLEVMIKDATHTG